MFRPPILLAVVLSIVVSMAPVHAKPGRDLIPLSLDSSEDTFPEESITDEEPNRSVGFGEFGSVLVAIKHQFRDIIVEIGLQVFNFMADSLKHFKVKLLRKLGMYTLSDVFHTVFDGVTDFVSEPAPEQLYYDTKEPVKPVAKPTYMYDSPYLSSFFRSLRQ